MPRVLVTGSSGRIGARVAERLVQGSAAASGQLAPEFDVVGLDLCPGARTDRIGDLLDTRARREALADVDAVVHCAAFHAPHVSEVDPARFRRVNVDGTRALLDGALAAGVRRFVYTSTTSVYGCTRRGGDAAHWVTEDMAVHAEDIYDETKLAAEALCTEAAGAGMAVTILRMSRCFPEPEHLQCFYRMFRGVGAADVADAHVLALTVAPDGASLFNVSGPVPFVVEDCALLRTDPWRVIDARVPGLHEAFEARQWPLPGSIDRVYVSTHAGSVLGYRPREDVQAVLAETSTENMIG